MWSLVDAWCQRRDLRHLAILLPAYTSNNGLADGWADLLDALYALRASSVLSEGDATVVSNLLPMVEAFVYRS